MQFFVLIVHLGLSFFFFNDTATTEIYTLSLHDALPIFLDRLHFFEHQTHERLPIGVLRVIRGRTLEAVVRSEEHTSELQSLAYLVCRLLLEKKNGHVSPGAFARVLGVRILLCRQPGTRR